eukprot:1164419-Prymnesium_polylepis.2
MPEGAYARSAASSCQRRSISASRAASCQRRTRWRRRPSRSKRATISAPSTLGDRPCLARASSSAVRPRASCASSNRSRCCPTVSIARTGSSMPAPAATCTGVEQSLERTARLAPCESKNAAISPERSRAA